MQLEWRALYNLLRMNWLNDPSMAVEPWQVEDYRALSLSETFQRLQNLSTHLDKFSFTAYAEECDSPEDLTGYLIGDKQVSPAIEDQIYLLVFELWRRLMSEKPSPSILCDELDYQIYTYDQGQSVDIIALQNSIANLLLILDENVDAGIDPIEALERVSVYCANDIETFLYDFISEQLEQEQLSYAQELLDDFQPYFNDNSWFTILRIRLTSHSNIKLAHKMVLILIENQSETHNLDLNLELLSLMAETGSHSLFYTIAKRALPLLRQEEDFQDLLAICIEYYHRLDQEQQEYQLQDLLHKRSLKSLTAPFLSNDPDLLTLLSLIEMSPKNQI